MKQEDTIYENQFYKLLDEIKILFFPDKWGTTLFDYSKNELMAITFIYRKNKVNISEIADYLMSPLNTVTGVINRLEKKGIVQRIRDKDDKRIVNISLTEKGLNEYNQGKESVIYYFKEIYSDLSEEERQAIFKVFTKVLKVISTDKKKKEEKNETGKRIKKITIE